MENFHVYRDIEARTGGEIYIGVVGPVRTGKSTFIKRFMETMVLPKLPDGHKKTLTRDELPQSAAGKMIMTTEPKFIPKEAAEIHLEDGIHAKIRLVDCVGFMVDGAVGHEENGEERLVKTPWFDHEIPFTYAAEIGTRKVIRDHSTIGIVITGDGSFGELGRNDYADAEARIIRELKEIGKPFIVLLNSVKPFGEEAKEMAGNMEELYGVTVQPVNCEQLKESDVKMILMNVLKEFPVQKLDFYIPKWMEILPDEHPLKMTAIEHARNILTNVDQMKDMKEEILRADGNSRVSDIVVRKTEMADGTVSVEILMDYDCYYEVISEYTGIPVKDEYVLFHTLAKLSEMQGE